MKTENEKKSRNETKKNIPESSAKRKKEKKKPLVIWKTENEQNETKKNIPIPVPESQRKT